MPWRKSPGHFQYLADYQRIVLQARQARLHHKSVAEAQRLACGIFSSYKLIKHWRDIRFSRHAILNIWPSLFIPEQTLHHEITAACRTIYQLIMAVI